MSLTANDLREIRNTVRSEVQAAFEQVGRKVVREEVRGYFNTEGRQLIKEEIKALDNDVKEIYSMLSTLQRSVFTDKQFSRLSLEQKLMTIHAETLAVAKQAGITLSSS